MTLLPLTSDVSWPKWLGTECALHTGSEVIWPSRARLHWLGVFPTPLQYCAGRCSPHTVVGPLMRTLSRILMVKSAVAQTILRLNLVTNSWVRLSRCRQLLDLRLEFRMRNFGSRLWGDSFPKTITSEVLSIPSLLSSSVTLQPSLIDRPILSMTLPGKLGSLCGGVQGGHLPPRLAKVCVPYAFWHCLCHGRHSQSGWSSDRADGFATLASGCVVVA